MNKISYKIIKPERILAFLCGVFCTMPIVAIPFTGRIISVFTIVFIIQLLDLFLFHIRTIVRIGKNSMKLFAWLLFSIVSTLSGMLLSFVYPELGVVIAYCPKILLYLAFIVLWNNAATVDNNYLIVRGLVFGSILNMLWATLDACIWYLAGWSLNNNVFAFYIGHNGVKRISLPLNNGLYRSGGFNHDPAHLGFLCPFLVYYALKKKDLRILGIAVLGMISSASTTAIVCSIVIFLVVELDEIIYSSNRALLNPRLTLTIILSMVFLIIFAICLRGQIEATIGKASQLFYSRAKSVYFSNDSSGGPRMNYIKFFPQAFDSLGFFRLTGLGFGSSGFGYSHEPSIASKIGLGLKEVYDVENTYFDYIMDTGIIGFSIFIYFMGVLFKYYKKKMRKREMSIVDIVSMAGVVSMALSFIFYHYVVFAPQMILIIVALSNMDLCQRREEISIVFEY